jgi:DNA polymerase-1
MDLRKLNKYESTYTRSWIRRVRIAGKPRLYTSYNLGGTVTGRLSSNMQQVPRDTFIRSIIGAKKGHKLIEADFSQIELRIAAIVSGDRALSQAFIDGRDPHMETAEAILHKPPSQINKEERKLAKSVGFGFLYGMGPNKFITYAFEKYGIEVSAVEAKRFRDAFFNRYSGLLPWHQRQRRLVDLNGEVRSPIGRIRHLASVRSSDEGVVAEAQRQAINSPVQGLASDLTVLSMVLLHQKMDAGRGRILGNLHDAIIFEVRDEYIDEATGLIRETMENLPLQRYFGFNPKVPIRVDVQVVDHWGGS